MEKVCNQNVNSTTRVAVQRRFFLAFEELHPEISDQEYGTYSDVQIGVEPSQRVAIQSALNVIETYTCNCVSL